MPRGARRDLAITKLLRANGLLLDSRSFVSLGEPHLYLKGADMIAQRARVFTRDKGTCANCGRQATDPDSVDLHHKVHRGRGGSDDASNLELLCIFCHRQEHVAVQFGRNAEEIAGS